VGSHGLDRKDLDGQDVAVHEAPDPGRDQSGVRFSTISAVVLYE
jgi:hypothetical protein